jgi:hypothetical protein
MDYCILNFWEKINLRELTFKLGELLYPSYIYHKTSYIK